MSKEKVEAKSLFDYIDNLKQAKDKLQNDYQNVVDIINELQQENKQLKEDLQVSQTNEETYRLEMQEITKILGLDEDTLFDDVKECAKQLQQELNKKNKIIEEIKNWLKEHIELSTRPNSKVLLKSVLANLEELEKGSEE